MQLYEESRPLQEHVWNEALLHGKKHYLQPTYPQRMMNRNPVRNG